MRDSTSSVDAKPACGSRPSVVAIAYHFCDPAVIKYSVISLKLKDRPGNSALQNYSSSGNTRAKAWEHMLSLEAHGDQTSGNGVIVFIAQIDQHNMAA